MDEKNTFKLLLNDKSFSIPSSFRFINDVNPDIFKELINKKQYKVQSRISEKVFTSFINNWITNEPPNITHENFSEYEQLSNEFDRLKDIITLFKNKSLITTEYSLKYENQKYEKEKSLKKDQLKTKKIKYQEIIHILFDNNSPKHYLHLLENKRELLSACLDEDSNSISLLTKKIIKNSDFSFSLNEEDKTATVFHLLSEEKQIFIPRSVTYESTEFIITRISENSFKFNEKVKSVTFPCDSEVRFIDKKSFFGCLLSSISIPPHVKILNESVFDNCRNLKHITFPENSELKTICKNAFCISKIESLTIPAGVEKLENGWCEKITHLNNIFIMKENKFFTYYDDQFILGKSDPKSDEFDILLFARRDIKVANIPSFIKRIGPCAFGNCCKLEEVNFSPDSKLEKIEFNVFMCSSLKKISIPSNVKKISRGAFELCHNLSDVTFASDSELKSIGKYAFAYSKIGNFTIPEKVEEIKYGCFNGAKKLNNIQIMEGNKVFKNYNNQFLLTKSDLKSDKFDILLFANRDIEEVNIPSFIKHLGPFSFDRCHQIEHVNFEPNSELQIIDDYSFDCVNVENFVIPKYVTQIGQNSFAHTRTKNIKFAVNSRLKTVGKFTFLFSKIESISIPSSVVNFNSNWCESAANLTNVIINPTGKQNILWYKKDFLIKKSDEKSDIFDIILLARKNIRKAIIPSFIKQIANSAFTECRNIDEIVFHPDSKLELIDDFAFMNSSINTLIIPKNLKKIGYGTFCGCYNLNKVFISEDSELQVIGQETFSYSQIDSIFIPQHVNEIRFGAFCNCFDLQVVEISNNSELKIIGIDTIKPKLLFIPSELKDHLYFKK